MTQLDNVKNIALEIQPCVVSPGSAGIATASAAIAAGASTVAAKSANANGAVSMNVVLRVSVKKGVDYCFVMGMDDSQLLVQSIYARLNGDSPPRIAPKSKSNGSSGGGESSSSSVAKAAKSGASGGSLSEEKIFSSALSNGQVLCALINRLHELIASNEATHLTGSSTWREIALSTASLMADSSSVQIQVTYCCCASSSSGDSGIALQQKEVLELRAGWSARACVRR